MSQSELDKAIEKIKGDDKLNDDAKERQIDLLKTEFKNKELNAQRSGVGTRLMAALTRGKGSQVITYEGFDREDAASLPKSLKQFNEIAKFDESKILNACIDAFNSDNYASASDPVNEYVDAAWTAENKAKFKAAVKAIASAQTDLDIAAVVAIVKPLFAAKG